jgi:hypothetical protein
MIMSTAARQEPCTLSDGDVTVFGASLLALHPVLDSDAERAL